MSLVRQIFLDTETTGLSAAGGDRIIELGCIEMVNRRLTGRNLHLYFNPGRASHPDALKVHGLTEAFLADKPPFADKADEVMSFLAGAEVIIHNAEFDVGFMDAELARVDRAGLRSQVGAVLDTLFMAREQFPGKSNSLDALCRRLEVDNSQRTLHGALLDASLLAEVYIRMTRGQGTLVIGLEEGASGSATAAQAVDLAALDLIIIPPSAEERAAHQAWLVDLVKPSGGKVVWKTDMA